jgi:hypothetical protein
MDADASNPVTFSVTGPVMNPVTDLKTSDPETDPKTDPMTTSPETDPMTTNPKTDPKLPRFLKKMEVRVKDTSRAGTIAGSEGFITAVIPPDTCFVQVCCKVRLAKYRLGKVRLG